MNLIENESKSIPNNHNNVKSIFDCWLGGMREYFSFSGRCSRYEFWSFLFVNTLLFGILFGICRIFNWQKPFSEIYLLYMLPPVSSMITKRLHDASMNGWWNLPFILLSLITIINLEYTLFLPKVTGFILLFYISFMFWLLNDNGDKIKNDYGERIMERQIYNDDSQIFFCFMFGCLALCWILYIWRIM